MGREGGYTIGESKQKLEPTRTTEMHIHSWSSDIGSVHVLQKPAPFIIELNTYFRPRSKRTEGGFRERWSSSWPGMASCQQGESADEGCE